MNFGTIGAGTIAQALARHLVTAGHRVMLIKAFNTLHAEYIAPDPRHPAGRQLLFYAGDDAAAKGAFRELVDSFGFAPVDIGALRDGGRLMQVGGGPLSALHALRQD